jgi:ATP-dependent Clp protease ATP-binding subunit ClpC
MNIMLQILDEGRLTDAKGRHVDFSNTVIIMTSNLGAAEAMRAAQNGIGFAGNNAKLTADDIENIIIKSARSRFSPELWNRIEERLVFHALTEDQIKRIAHLLLNDSRKRLLTDKRIALSFDETALIPYLIQNGGFEPAYGARPMRKTIQSHIESKVAEWILEHDTTPQELYVGMKNGRVYVEEIEPL